MCIRDRYRLKAALRISPMPMGRGSAAPPGCPIASLMSGSPFCVGSGRGPRALPRRLAKASAVGVVAPILERHKSAVPVEPAVGVRGVGHEALLHLATTQNRRPPLAVSYTHLR